MLNKPWLVLSQATCLERGVGRRKWSKSCYQFKESRSFRLPDLYPFHILGHCTMVETFSGTSHSEQIKIEFNDYSVNLIDVADQSVGLKLLTSAVDRQKLKLLMTSLACLLSLLNQWSKDKIRLWLKLSHSKWKNEQCLRSHTVISTSWSCWGTSHVILGNSVNILETLFPHLWNNTYLTHK